MRWLNPFNFGTGYEFFNVNIFFDRAKQLGFKEPVVSTASMPGRNWMPVMSI